MRNFPIKTLETLVNAYLRLDPQLETRFHPLVDKQFLLEITDINATFYIFFHADKITISLQSFEQAPDLTVRGNTRALWRLFQSNASNFQLHLRDVKVVGDLHLAQSIQLFFQSIDIDWEEQLSRFTGDVIAHQFFRGITILRQWQREVRENVKQNLTEYLQEEAHYFPLAEEVKTFMYDVDVLRDDIERLEIRIEQLGIYDEPN